MLIWDNLNTHVCAAMKQFIENHAWLTVYQLPAYSPDLNPTEGVWSLLRRALVNIAFANLAHLEQAIRQRLRTIQHRPEPRRRTSISGHLAYVAPAAVRIALQAAARESATEVGSPR